MGAKVLIAEDNDELRTLLSMLLTRVGYTMIEASNGLEAIDQAVKTHPDLIIMDLLMPQLGGLEATKRLKENLATRDIPIVICTALSTDALGHRKLLDSAQEVIQKPVRLEKIKEIVRKYVPDENQRQPTSLTPEKKQSTDVVGAQRLLQKMTDSINEDSLQVGFPEVHNFEKRAEAGPAMALKKPSKSC